MNKAKVASIVERGIKKYLFIGQKIYFEKTSLNTRDGNLESRFLSYTYDQPWSEAWKGVEEFNPDVIIIYRPEVFDPIFLEQMRAKFISVGFFTEPLPYRGFEAEFDLIRRFEPFKKYNYELCDFHVIYNDETCEAIKKQTDILFSHPLPVNDKLFVDAPAKLDSLKGIFYGRVTEARNNFLMPLKHNYDWTVVDHGSLEESFFRNFNVALNLHSDSYLNFENRVFYHMAQSLLVLSEPLVANHGLQKNIDYFEFQNTEELENIVIEINKDLTSIYPIINNAYVKASQFKASKFLDILKNKIINKVNT